MRQSLARLLVLMLVLAGAAGLVLAQPNAQSDQTPAPTISRVTEDDIFVRAGPGRDYLPIGRLQAGDPLRPLSRDPSGSWILIVYGDAVGWIRRDLASWVENLDVLPVLSPPELTPSPGIPTVTPTYLLRPTETPTGNWVQLDPDAASGFVRAGPGRTFLRLGQLTNGDQVEPVGRNQDSTWILIRFGAGFGWIARNLVRWVEPLDFLPVLSLDNLTPSPTFTATHTSTATPTPTPTVIPSPTSTPTATFTPTATTTSTPTATLTWTPSATPTLTATPTTTSTSTPTATLTWTPSATPTLTATSTPTYTATVTPSATPTAVPSDTPSPSATALPTKTTTPTAAPALTETIAPTATPSAAPAPTETIAPTATPSVTPTLAPSNTPQPTATFTATLMPTATPTATEAVVAQVATSTPIPTIAPSSTPTAAPTLTSTPSVTPSPSATNTLTPTATASSTTTELPSQTPTTQTTETPVAAVVGETLTAAHSPTQLPPSPTPPLEPVTTPPPAARTGQIAPEAIVGGVVLLALLVYALLYWRGLMGTERYMGGFVVKRCPVCGRGDLVVETRPAWFLGIQRARHLVRCTECRSVLRQTRPDHWRYAVDPLENPELYRRFNGQEIDEQTLVDLSAQTGRRPAPRPPANPTEMNDR